ncbi:MAG: hypothetical protein E6700_09800 [Winkia neuii]|uniref:Ribonuclease PH n=1 Tax=Winkia neuii TaxID=33007 RepID=A0A2I1IMI7_9ACTO|nr:hypothetical protein [Winkia neuii]OFJ68646.1 hypothetical protein HMPREF2851_01825 [Actinomyces sp. HMSC064C12]OFK00134.1 hypothetical protein HMPREF2835_03445 [Actinomyces sp. HMSC072A03]OFT56724.1 hypothetical protein HMPREF3152_00520 [Actinomyces sp. HMSC06A08]KWZ75186.1 hypothetical protein HMPREF3198_00266 [Winkia neuii]MDK8099797.1 hypothetical protein [Winkia neuii]
MKRAQVIKRLKQAAKAANLSFEVREGTRQTQIKVGSTSKSLGRHNEIPDIAARKFFEQYAQELGKEQ